MTRIVAIVLSISALSFASCASSKSGCCSAKKEKASSCCQKPAKDSKK